MASFEQYENRKWAVRFRYVEFGRLKQTRLRGFNTKKEAEKAYYDFIAIHNQGTKRSENSEMTLNQLFQNYLEYVKTRLKIGSIYDISHAFQKHLLPVFGNMKVFQITKRDIFDWQTKLNKTKYSYKFKCKLRGYMSAIFKYAVYYFDLQINPVTQVEPFKRLEPKKEMQIWDVEEFNQFIQQVDDEIFKTFFLFLYLTGCRKGEAFALTWDKLDFTKKTVKINRNLTRKVDGAPYVITTTKTSNSRTILLPQVLINALLEIKSNQENYSDNNFVFGGTKPLADRTTSRKFEEAIKKANVKNIHLHCLRHSHASFLISQGESIVMVSKRLGHATVQQTLNTYSHLMPNEEQSMVTKLELNLSNSKTLCVQSVSN